MTANSTPNEGRQIDICHGADGTFTFRGLTPQEEVAAQLAGALVQQSMRTFAARLSKDLPGLIQPHIDASVRAALDGREPPATVDLEDAFARIAERAERGAQLGALEALRHQHLVPTGAVPPRVKHVIRDNLGDIVRIEEQ